MTETWKCQHITRCADAACSYNPAMDRTEPLVPLEGLLHPLEARDLRAAAAILRRLAVESPASAAVALRVLRAAAEETT